MDFELLGLELINVFKVTHNDLMFFGRNIQSENLEYSLKLDTITPELITRWASKFPAGSYFSVSKESNQTRLTLIISISENDYSEYFKLRHSQLVITNFGILQRNKELDQVLESLKN